MRIGVDIGGTGIKAGIDNDGKIISFAERATEAEKGRKKVLENVRAAISEIIEDDVESIGIGCPGPFKDIDAGLIGKQANLPLDNVNLVKEIESRFAIPVKINNDAKCFVLGEAIYGKGQNYNVVAGFTLGTGIGTGLVMDGKPYVGRGNSFEFGQSQFEGKTVEHFLGKKAIIRMAREKGVKIKETIELYELARKGNRKAISVWNGYGKLLGKAIASFIDIVDPEVIYLGGNISGAYKLFKDSMNKEIEKKVFYKACKVEKSSLEHAGVIGAAYL